MAEKIYNQQIRDAKKAAVEEELKQQIMLRSSKAEMYNAELDKLKNLQKIAEVNLLQCVAQWQADGSTGRRNVFEKLDANLAKAVMSIGAVKSVEIGDGSLVARRFGSENNDAFYCDEKGNVGKKTNHAGGILGGISDGSALTVRAYVKPTPSIYQTQQTINQPTLSLEIAM